MCVTFGKLIKNETNGKTIHYILKSVTCKSKRRGEYLSKIDS